MCTYTWKDKFDRITRMINEVNLQVFLLNSHSIITTFSLCGAACLDSHLNLEVQFERQLISASNLSGTCRGLIERELLDTGSVFSSLTYLRTSRI